MRHFHPMVENKTTFYYIKACSSIIYISKTPAMTSMMWHLLLRLNFKWKATSHILPSTLFWQCKLSVAARSTPAPPALWAAWLTRSQRCLRTLTTTCPSTAMALEPPLWVSIQNLYNKPQQKQSIVWCASVNVDRMVTWSCGFSYSFPSAGYQHAKTVEVQQRSSSVATQQTTVSSVPSHPSTTGVSNTHTHTYT